MKYGVYLPNFGDTGDARVMGELAGAAEASGWDGFFLWDHVAVPWPVDVVDVTVALTAIALGTERIRFGALVTPLARRRPVKFAREMASLDRLSGGRLVVGAALGVDEEMVSLGESADPHVRAEMLDEALDLVTALWRGELVTHAGAHYAVQALTCLPTPLQQPRIPIWLGGAWPNRKPFLRAARWDGAFPIAAKTQGPDDVLQPETLRQVIEFIDAHGGREDGFEVLAWGTTPGEDPLATVSAVLPYEEAGATWWLENISPMRGDLDPQAHGSPLAGMRARIVQGPPPR